VLIHRTVPDAQPARLPASPGAIVTAEQDRLEVATGEGLLRIEEIQPEGRRVMAARDWLAGHEGLRPGARFTRERQ
jgi:methionyl-tRNA formyltransferase